MNNDVKVLSAAEHVRLRFGMYGGSKDVEPDEIYLDGEFKTVEYSKGLIKIINEIIDNAVEEYIKTKGQYSTRIDVVANNDVIAVKDNGRGIPAKRIKAQDGSEKWMAEVAFTSDRAGSNFNDDTREGLGANGVGSFITFCTSTEFTAESCDHSTGTKITVSKTETGHNVKESKCSKHGTLVTFKPEYEFFGLSGLDDIHKKIIKERIRTLSLAFPGITFRFNGKPIKEKTQNYFNTIVSITTSTGAWIGLGKSNDTFKSTSIVNGLTVKNGTHINYIFNQVAEEFILAFKRKHKIELSKARLKNHLTIYTIINNVKALKFDSQTKERITNTISEIRPYVGHFDTKKVVRQLLANQELITEIKGYYQLQEQLNAKKDLRRLEKKKKINSKTYYPSVGTPERLIISEGLSANGGLMSILGRKGNAFYALKGVPLNVLEISHQKFMANGELSTLYQIIKLLPENIDIIIASDADADGIRITGLLVLFFYKYLPEIIQNGKLKKLVTPIATAKKKDKLVDWVYDFGETKRLVKPGVVVNYVKGLGSWSKKDLEHIISKEGFDTLTPVFPVPAEQELLNWFAGSHSDVRKEQIANTEAFDIEKI